MNPSRSHDKNLIVWSTESATFDTVRMEAKKFIKQRHPFTISFFKVRFIQKH